MHTFTDKTGEDWRIEFDIPIIEDIKRELDIDLLHLGSLQQLNQIRDSSLLLIDVLEIVCAEQIGPRYRAARREIHNRFAALKADPGELTAEEIDEQHAAALEALGDAPRFFAKRFTGETIDLALRAVMEAIVDFFPPSQRPVLARALANGDKMVAMLNEQAMRQLDDPQYWQQVAAAMEHTPPPKPPPKPPRNPPPPRTSGAPSTNSPPSPASATSASAA